MSSYLNDYYDAQAAYFERELSKSEQRLDRVMEERNDLRLRVSVLEAQRIAGGAAHRKAIEEAEFARQEGERVMVEREALRAERDELNERFVDMNRQAVEACEELSEMAAQRDALVEALEHFVRWAESSPEQRSEPEFNLARARAAIAKARGTK